MIFEFYSFHCTKLIFGISKINAALFLIVFLLCSAQLTGHYILTAPCSTEMLQIIYFSFVFCGGLLLIMSKSFIADAAQDCILHLLHYVALLLIDSLI